jgi:citrate lyase subunit beta / citryl-CoA lyase
MRTDARWRSLLFIPANNERFIAKAHTRGADAIQLDLEDSVPFEQKAAARANLAGAIAMLVSHKLDIVVRINRSWRQATADLDACIRHGVLAITLPKVEDPGHVRALSELTNELEAEREIEPGSIGLILQIESPAALPRLSQLATACDRVIAMTLGPEDYALAAGCDTSDEALLTPNLLVAQTAASAGLRPLGFVGSIAKFDDREEFLARIRQARRLGFRGAFVIHPDQARLANEGFSSTEAEVAWSRRVVLAADAALQRGRGACQLDGKMIDAPVVQRARNVIAESRGRDPTGRAEATV